MRMTRDKIIKNMLLECQLKYIVKKIYNYIMQYAHNIKQQQVVLVLPLAIRCQNNNDCNDCKTLKH